MTNFLQLPSHKRSVLSIYRYLLRKSQGHVPSLILIKEIFCKKKSITSPWISREELLKFEKIKKELETNSINEVYEKYNTDKALLQKAKYGKGIIYKSVSKKALIPPKLTIKSQINNNEEFQTNQRKKTLIKNYLEKKNLGLIVNFHNINLHDFKNQEILQRIQHYKYLKYYKKLKYQYHIKGPYNVKIISRNFPVFNLSFKLIRHKSKQNPLIAIYLKKLIYCQSELTIFKEYLEGSRKIADHGSKLPLHQVLIAKKIDYKTACNVLQKKLSWIIKKSSKFNKNLSNQIDSYQTFYNKLFITKKANFLKVEEKIKAIGGLNFKMNPSLKEILNEHGFISKKIKL